MADNGIKITLIPNGPAQVETGRAEITLIDGTTVTKDAPFALCRCGHSKTKPFCDGSHVTSGFKG